MREFEDMDMKEIDYQNMFFFNDGKWLDIIDTGKVEGVKLHSVQLERLNKWMFPLSKKYSDLVLAGSIEKTGDMIRFMVYSLINFSGYYQRVELRPSTCSNCKEKLVLGNPFVSDIYFGVPIQKEIQKIMNKAHRFKIIENCPLCGVATINQSAVWVKPSLYSNYL